MLTRVIFLLFCNYIITFHILQIRFTAFTYSCMWMCTYALWQRMPIVPQDPSCLSFETKFPEVLASYRITVSSPELETWFPAPAVARCSHATGFLPVGGQWGNVCYLWSPSSENCTEDAPLSLPSPSSGLQQRGAVGEPASIAQAKTKWGQYVEQSCPLTLGWCLPLNCSREERQIVSFPTHDTPGFLSYSSLGYALTDTALLHLTKGLRQCIRNSYGKIKIQNTK